jgi:hypothetical protein
MLPIRFFSNNSHTLFSTKLSRDLITNRRFFSITQNNNNKETPKVGFKEVIKKYGKIGLGFYVALSCTTFSIISVSLFSGVDIDGLLKKYVPCISNSSNESNVKMGAGSVGTTLAIAFALNKLLTPFKMTTTVICTPYIARYLKSLKKK